MEAVESPPADPQAAGHARRRRLVLAILAVAVLWVVVTGVLLLVARPNLVAAERDLARAREALGAGDHEAAAGAFERADQRLSTSRRLLHTPPVWLAARVPYLGRSVRTVTVLADATAAATAAGRTVGDAIEALPNGVASLAPSDGVLPVEAISMLAPAFREAADTLDEAVARGRSAPSTLLLGAVASARERFLALGEPAARQATIAAALSEALPAFLGADGPRRYFLGASNPAELRGTGGYIGSYAIATFDRGRMEIGTFRALFDLPNLPVDQVDPPNEWFAARYDHFGGAGFWQNINVTPDFASAATAIERLWEATTGQPLDGTIVVDPFALETLLELVGEVEVPEEDIALDAETVVAYVANEAYADLPDLRERKEVLGHVAAVALERFLGSADVEELGDVLPAMGRLAAGRHLQIHAADAEIQAAFELAGVSGRLLDPDGDLIAVFANSATASKVDFYLEREIAYEVRLLPDGSAEGRLDVEFHNHAPTEGLSRHVLGPNAGIERAGDNRLLVSAFCARGCEFTAGPEDDRGRPAVAEVELDHPVVDRWITMRSGEAHRLGYEWRVAGGWTVEDREVVYRLAYHDQVMIRPTTLRVRLLVPPDLRVRATSPHARVEDGMVAWEHTGRGDVHFEVRMTGR